MPDDNKIKEILSRRAREARMGRTADMKRRASMVAGARRALTGRGQRARSVKK